jgi:anti-anti-sigma factor
MKISTSIQDNGAALLAVEGEVDAATAGDLDKALGDWLAQGRNRLILDFSQVNYISSAGLRVLLRAQQKAHELGGDVRLFGPNAHVLKVFVMAGFDQILRLTATLQEAQEGW